MRASFKRILVVLVVFLAWAGAPALAADVEFPAPDNAVSVHGVTTYLDLARHFVPDIKNTGNGYAGTKRIKIRHIAGPGYENEDAASFGFYDIARVMMKADGKDRLLVLFDFAQAAQTAQGVAVLALYDISHQPVLLDAADIGFDQSTYFFDQALMPVAEGSDVILTMSSHFNSSQAYVTQSMIMVRNDKLELIDTAMLFGERNCGVDRQQTIAYAANPSQGKPYAPIKVTVNDTTSAIEEVCADLAPAQLGKKEIKVTYIWDTAAGKYVPDSDAIERLAKDNESRF
ncbi:hypothetical protein IHQ71_22260 [Rhizobium sp. TH2]|uniref:hypothetical protein n=1 Tax=Rhizobium sp. TH2 TaxID=2775403 RepID=UPI002157E513|nr:hypothetical protein [Rhizobium sp. TH2]UVC07879.1 hypothetical protein IHQ71_22260 [Rhizobium sp. TH2]